MHPIVDFVVGIVQGVNSNMLLLVPSVLWEQHFGGGQANPISGEDGGLYSKAKYLGRLLGGAFPYYALLLIVCKILFHTP